jgi:ABC-type transport system substrate-binding protein
MFGNFLTQVPEVLRFQSTQTFSIMTYHGQAQGNVEHIEMSFYSDPEEELAHYEAGDLHKLDIGRYPPAYFQISIQRHANDYITWPYFGTYLLSFNVNQSPLDDPRIRRALVLATDRRHLVDVHGMGRNLPATGGFVPPGIPGHIPGIALPYDLEKSRLLLADAGFPGGRGLPCLRALLFPWDVDRLPAFIFNPWQAEIGLQVVWEQMEFPEFPDRILGEQPHITAAGWSVDYPDPDNNLRVGLGTFGNWRHEIYDGLVDRARRSLIQDERLSLYRQAEEILVEEVPIVPLYYYRLHLLLKPWIRNYQPETIYYHYWKDVVIEPH